MNNLKGTRSDLTQGTVDFKYLPNGGFSQYLLFQHSITGPAAFDWRVWVPSTAHNGELTITNVYKGVGNTGEAIARNTWSRWFSVENDGGFQISVYAYVGGGGGGGGFVPSDPFDEPPELWDYITHEIRFTDFPATVDTENSRVCWDLS